MRGRLRTGSRWTAVRWVLGTVLAVVSLARAADIRVPVYVDSLENGLKVIMAPDSTVPVVSCRLYYFVGSMYEGPGTSGLSHMFEHMMFKGTRRLGTTNYRAELPYMARIDSLAEHMMALREQGADAREPRVSRLRAQMDSLLAAQRAYVRKDELWDTYQRNGGTRLNAWTSDDMTAYIVTLPRNKLELFFWMESDRMSEPVLREFYSERDVVTEERRMRYENRPVNRYWERLFALFYVAHPYRLPTIGWMSDIEAYTRPKLRSHVRRFYTPDNALLVLVGSIDTAQVRRQVRQYFGHIPRAASPKEEVVTREPPPIGQTRFVVHDRAEPRVDMLFHTPGYPHEDLYALDILEGVLNGASGRLHRALVLDRELCTSAGARNALRLHDGYFHVYASLRQGTDPDTVEDIISEELAGLAREAPRPREIERVKNEIRMSFVSGLASLEGLSDRLAWFERLGDWHNLFSYPERIESVQSDSIPVVASRWFQPHLATVGLLLEPVQSAETAVEPAVDGATYEQ